MRGQLWLGPALHTQSWAAFFCGGYPTTYRRSQSGSWLRPAGALGTAAMGDMRGFDQLSRRGREAAMGVKLDTPSVTRNGDGGLCNGTCAMFVGQSHALAGQSDHAAHRE